MGGKLRKNTDGALSRRLASHGQVCRPYSYCRRARLMRGLRLSKKRQTGQYYVII